MNSKKRYVQLILLGIISFSSALLAMEDHGVKEPPLKRPRLVFETKIDGPNVAYKQAWQLAYQGKFEESRKLFLQAAAAKHPLAIEFLAASYENGTLITDKDIEKAKPLRSQVPDRARWEPWGLTYAIIKKYKKVCGDNFARQNEWYCGLKYLFEDITHNLYKYKMCTWCQSLKRQRWFHFPPPSEGLPELVHQYVIGNIEKENWHCLKKGISAALGQDPQGEFYTRILKSLKHLGDPFEYHHNRKNKILSLLQRPNQTHDSEYWEVYKLHLTSDCHRFMYNDGLPAIKRDHLLKELIQRITDYHKRDPKEAISLLANIFYNYEWEMFNPHILTILRTLYSLNTDKRDQLAYADFIMTFFSREFLSALLTTPDLAHAFEHTPLSVENILDIIETAFKIADQREARAPNSGI